MLTITPNASNAIRGVLDASDAPDGSIFRISPQAQDGTAPGPALSLSVIDAPPPDDEVVEGDGVAVCLEPSAAAMLDDKQLDAEVVGEQINFSISEQTG
jgi:Fe-S cluster assembly iron-binding protein IscA